MKKIMLLFLSSIFVVCFFIYGEEKSEGINSKGSNIKIRITFNNTVLTATMYDNATTRSFVKKLPLTLFMMDLYDREMVYRFPEPLPAEETSTRGYKVGEIIYYPPLHSFVIMYAQNGERFKMQSMGYVDTSVHLLNGLGNTKIRFELIKD